MFFILKLTFFGLLSNIMTVFLQGFPLGKAAFFFFLLISPAENFKGSKGCLLPPNIFEMTLDSTAVAFFILDKMPAVFCFTVGISVIEVSPWENAHLN